METKPAQHLVEEEYFISVPLVRPSTELLAVLKSAGATGSVFTKKEIIHHLKNYIRARQLFDVLDPRIVHCANDPLFHVFGVDMFTVDDVLVLIEATCSPVPDHCLKRKRRLVAKPVTQQMVTEGPVSVSVSLTCTPPTTQPTEASSAPVPRDMDSSVITSTSTEQTSETTSSLNDLAEQTVAEEQPLLQKKCKKRKKKSEKKTNVNNRKRHQTEPCSHEAGKSSDLGQSSRRRGTSLSISVEDDPSSGEREELPWLFKVEVEDEDGNQSEILSVQDGLTVHIPSDTEFSVEYDVNSDHTMPLSESDLASVGSGEGCFLVVCQESDVEFFADDSDMESVDGDRELSEQDNWSCPDCNNVNYPLQRYCGKCWKIRTDWLPRQPGPYDLDQGRDAKYCLELKLQCVSDSGIGTQNSSQESVKSDVPVLEDKQSREIQSVAKSLTLPTAASIYQTLMPVDKESQAMETRYSFLNTSHKMVSASLLETSSGNSSNGAIETKSASDPDDRRKPASKQSGSGIDEPCMICLTRPKTASLIHGSSGHQVCCFQCAKRLKRRGKVCPVCRRPIQKVIKNYIV
ncbi:E3 ubiquitin-protein ligase Mdm2-like [Dreissena polymorpha]|nr:E3 ubiquitin-protein ligase Mdm2-like [Dreissena polymorpha]XP_052252812.1 E3 ubiquitin-protein ligase Mdm2-like [Dreissena polymorpha]